MFRTLIALGLVSAMVTFADIPQAAAQQKCWSAQKCGGKVLSNRDCHNCKVKSKGKSWSNASGTCYPVGSCP